MTCAKGTHIYKLAHYVALRCVTLLFFLCVRVCVGPLSILQPALLGTPLLNMLNITEPFCYYCIISVPRAFWLIVPAPLYIFYITLNRFTLINIRDVYLHSVADYGKCLYKFLTNTSPFVLYIVYSVCL